MMKPKQLGPRHIVKGGELVDDGKGGYRPYTGVLGAFVGEYSYPLYERRAILIIGHGGHGKGTLCKLLTELYGAECMSSSQAALPHIWPALREASRLNYYSEPLDSPEHAYAQRAHFRELWRELISLYNTPDKTTLAREILSQADVYDGMRCVKEFEATRHLFDRIVWVDASERVGTVDPSMSIRREVADIVVYNNGTLDDLRRIATTLGLDLGVTP